MHCGHMAQTRLLFKATLAVLLCAAPPVGAFVTETWDGGGADNNIGTGVVKICSHTGNMEAECINAATRNIANADANGVKASRLCASAPAYARAYCFEGMGALLGSLVPAGTDPRHTCDPVTPVRYRPDCYRGTLGHRTQQIPVPGA